MARRNQSDRRRFLQASGVTLRLPMLDAFLPRAGAKEKTDDVPRRMVCVCAPLGRHPEFFFPEQAGRDYQATPYLSELQEFRDQFTVMSGLAHP